MRAAVVIPSNPEIERTTLRVAAHLKRRWEDRPR